LDERGLDSAPSLELETALRSEMALRSETALWSETALRSEMVLQSETALQSEMVLQSETALQSEKALESKNLLELESVPKLKDVREPENVLKTEDVPKSKNALKKSLKLDDLLESKGLDSGSLCEFEMTTTEVKDLDVLLPLVDLVGRVVEPRVRTDHLKRMLVWFYLPVWQRKPDWKENKRSTKHCSKVQSDAHEFHHWRVSLTQSSSRSVSNKRTIR
jgi:hypothetical protein